MGRKISEPLRRLLAAVICFSLIFAAVLVLSPVSAEDLSEGETAVAVEDLYDVTGGTVLQTGDASPLGALSGVRDVAFTADIRYTGANGNPFILGVFCNGANAWENGYYFDVRQNNSTVRLRGGGSYFQTASDWDTISLEEATGEQQIVLSKLLNHTWVNLEFGRKTDGERTLVYVNLDGVAILEAEDTTPDEQVGTNVVTEMASRAVMQTSKAEASGQATVSDLYDLTGEFSHNGTTETEMANPLPSAENTAFKTKLRVTNLSAGNPVILGINISGSNGYFFTASGNESSSLGKHIGISGYSSFSDQQDKITADNLDPAQSAAFDKVMSGGWFELEIGRLTASAGETACYIIYAKIDGVEVLRFVDTDSVTATAVRPEMYGRGEMRTAYEPEYTETQSAACLYETVGALTLSQDSTFADAMTVSESAAFITEARITNLTNSNGLQIGIFTENNSTSTGYWFIAQPTQNRIALAGWGRDSLKDSFTAFDTGDGEAAYDAVMSGDWFTLEIGRVPATLQEETGFAVYAKINGVTVLQFFDTTATENLGTGFNAEMTSRAQLRTTYRESEIAEGFAALGGSVRVSLPTGLRFQFEFDESVIASLAELGVTAEYGAVLLPSEMLGGNELTLETAEVLDIPAENPGTGENGGVLISAVLTGIPETEYATAVTARAYIKLTAGEHVTIIYSETLERSVQQVAQAALADPDGGYTPEQIAVLEKFAGSTESSAS